MKSSINKIAQQVRDDSYRHAELVSASQTHPSLPLEREGTCSFFLAPLGRWLGEGLTNNDIFRFAQDDKSYLRKLLSALVP